MPKAPVKKTPTTPVDQLAELRNDYATLQTKLSAGYEKAITHTQKALDKQKSQSSKANDKLKASRASLATAKIAMKTKQTTVTKARVEKVTATVLANKAVADTLKTQTADTKAILTTLTGKAKLFKGQLNAADVFVKQALKPKPKKRKPMAKKAMVDAPSVEKVVDAAAEKTQAA